MRTIRRVLQARNYIRGDINRTPKHGSRALTALLAGIVVVFMAGCTAPQVTQALTSVQVNVDGESLTLTLDGGSTVKDALDQAAIELDTLDRVEPPTFTLLTDDAQIDIVRVAEEFSVEEVVVPFTQQVLRNESLPEGETRLIQPGVNGLEEITYRRVLEDGVEISNSRVKSTYIQEPVPEIVMVGSQSPFAAIPIPGVLAYLSGGNAWIMETSTGIRRPIVTTGDLDGRIFRLSPDGQSLLYTRASSEEEIINTLWVAPTTEDEEAEPLDLEVENVIHFADWSPQSSQILAYSTVEPRETAPGWQANNDLNQINLNALGAVSRRDELLEANSGGIYGWWGTEFFWAPDGKSLAYARPDGIGIFELVESESTTLLEMTPLQTNSDWAWVPGVGWSPDGNVLFTVDHSPPQGVVSAEESPFFDLKAYPILAGGPVSMVSEVGMFAYPVPSPGLDGGGTAGYQLAYLQSIFPTQSDTSRYRLVAMDRDGSNRRELFPPAGAPGLDPQKVVWSPQPMGQISSAEEPPDFSIAVVYQGNLWLVDALSGEGWQLTGDGLTSRLDWK